MRFLLSTVAILATAPALADTFEVQAPVTAATLYPQGASVIRSGRLDLPAGSHQLVIPGLPADTDPAGMRVVAEGATIGAVSLQTGRALPDGAPDTQAIKDARAEVERLERALRDRDAAVAAIRAEVEASEDLLSFLRTLASSDNATTGDVAGLTDMVAGRMLAARRAGIEAETRALAAEQGRSEDERLLNDAIARLDALQEPRGDQAALVLAVEGQGGPAQITVTSNADFASWRPVYDLRLDQQAKTLVLERGLMVAQSTGEDWSGVTLTMSTSRPSGQSTTSEVYPRVVRAYDPRAGVAERAYAPEPMADAALAAPVAEVEAVVVDAASVDFQGTTAVYRYAAPVDLRSSVDALRLKLDSRDLPVEVLVAEAVPLYDKAAYLVVDTKNPLAEVILPGPAALYNDGVMVGQMDLSLTAAGDEMQLGFGPIDGIVLDRRTPDRESAEGGLIRRDASMTETAVLEAKNLTGRDYQLRMIDQVPVSEQKEVVVDWDASVEPTEKDPDGKRGLLVWESELAAGATQEITLETTIRWPDGYVLSN
ncbi:mucoidy inhibitor MuiA family protein [Paracoccus xiamenensis]|uniref:mucoidy inhibitor MuiA family protein n=1 Tax=Paracoccus xiamenensis TaxID=2714901 RepID=UPI00140925F0|nr:mucoidy inhibitor MuiA family protein [Paracoccus xiamenensis]NHF72125.1 mucoidy inhibitor MuiA family protein [Paracoccus xiamenensis]